MLINLLVLKGSKNGKFTAYQLQCKLAAPNFLLETSIIISYLIPAEPKKKVLFVAVENFEGVFKN